MCLLAMTNVQRPALAPRPAWCKHNDVEDQCQLSPPFVPQSSKCNAQEGRVEPPSK